MGEEGDGMSDSFAGSVTSVTVTFEVLYPVVHLCNRC